MNAWTALDIGSLAGKVAVVTGANSGIGFETARMLAKKGARVVLACRDRARGDAAVASILRDNDAAQVTAAPLDLSDLEAVHRFSDAFSAEHVRLDLLINNAGVMMPPMSHTRQGFELQFGVNHLGHFALTGQLLPRLLGTAKSRVVTVASHAHRHGTIRFDDLHWQRRRYRPSAAYGQSKLANLLFTLALQERLANAGQSTLAVAAHPGWTATNLQQHWRLVERLNPLFGMVPAMGALPTLRAATDPDVRGGQYYGPGGFLELRGTPKRVGMTRAAQRREDAEQLWEVSEALTGTTFTFDPLASRRKIGTEARPMAAGSPPR